MAVLRSRRDGAIDANAAATVFCVAPAAPTPARGPPDPTPPTPPTPPEEPAALPTPFQLQRRLRRPALARFVPLAGLALGLLLMGSAPGCRQEAPPPAQQPDGQLLPAGSFRVAWETGVDTDQNGALDRLFLRDDLLFAYTEQNVVYAFNAPSGTTRFFTNEVAGPRDRLWPPVVVEAGGRLGQNIDRLLVFPGNTKYVVTTADQGRRVSSVLVSQGGPTQAITSPSYAAGRLAYVGLADQYGGRVVTVDPTRAVAPVLNPVQVRDAIISRPIYFNGLLYAADTTGAVTAITDNKVGAWARPFQSNGAVRANLVADDFALYVPSTDGVLYVLDRNTGRIKFQYFAQVALDRPPVVGRDNIFLPVPGRGVVCLSKTEGQTISRVPKWTVREAQDVLSQDDQNVYLLGGEGRILAVDKASGEVKFRSEGASLTRFAQNDTGSRIYAADESGRVVAIDPVLTRGQVGQLALGR